jgi:hypothetical protein
VIRQQVTRKLRADATQVGEFKMPPSAGRHKILGWRDSEPVTAVDDVGVAQKLVAATQMVLSDLSSVTVTWPVTGGGDMQK